MNYGMASSYGYVANAPAGVRADFIRRVYGLFFTSILVTILAGVLGAQPAVAPILLSAWPVLTIAGFVCVFALSFARRTPILNLALFYLFAGIEGAILGPVLVLLNRYAPGIPMEAAALTATVFGGLSLYALTSRKDFSFLGGFLFVALIALVVAGFILFFVHSPLISLMYSVGGVVIFSGFVLYDTSLIMRRLSPDEAVVGAISIYLDFLNLFWFILQLLIDLNRRD